MSDNYNTAPQMTGPPMQNQQAKPQPQMVGPPQTFNNNEQQPYHDPNFPSTGDNSAINYSTDPDFGAQQDPNFIPQDPNFGSPDDMGIGTKLSKDSRIGFIRKVYGIFATQILTTIVFITCALSIKAMQNWMLFNWPLILIAIAIEITTMCILSCSRKCAKSVPINYILLAMFTLAESYIV